jgi:hypothetical protein
MMIFVVRIFKVYLNLHEEQVLAVRVWGTDESTDKVARQLWSAWLEQNPNTFARMEKSGTSARDRGIG